MAEGDDRLPPEVRTEIRRARRGENVDHEVLLPWIVDRIPRACSQLAVLDHRLSSIEQSAAKGYDVERVKSRVSELEERHHDGAATILKGSSIMGEGMTAGEVISLAAFAVILWLALWPADLSLQNLISILEQLAGK